MAFRVRCSAKENGFILSKVTDHSISRLITLIALYKFAAILSGESELFELNCLLDKLFLASAFNSYGHSY